MNDFQNSTSVSNYSFAPEDNSVSAPAFALQAAIITETTTAAASDEQSWKDILLSAKAAYQNGDETEALRLYKLGLEHADRALTRPQLIQFLGANLWS